MSNIIVSKKSFKRHYSIDTGMQIPCSTLSLCIRGGANTCVDCELFQKIPHTSPSDLYNKSIDILRLAAIGMSSLDLRGDTQKRLTEELKGKQNG